MNDVACDIFQMQLHTGLANCFKCFHKCPAYFAQMIIASSNKIPTTSAVISTLWMKNSGPVANFCSDFYYWLLSSFLWWKQYVRDILLAGQHIKALIGQNTSQVTQVTPLNGRGKGCIRFPNSVSFACSVCAAQSQKLRVFFFTFLTI